MRNLGISYVDVRNLLIWKRRILLSFIEKEYKTIEKKLKEIETEISKKQNLFKKTS